MKLHGCRMSALHEGWRALGILALVWAHLGIARADSIPTEVLDPNLAVAPFATGFTQPIGIVFLGADDFLVLEKASGQIKRVINGVTQPTPVLDLAVNSASERGLLSMVLHPDFPTDPSVFIRWTESSTGNDTSVISEVPFLGNRIDRFLWNGFTLTIDENVIQLRARQTDNVPVPGHPGTNNANEAGNHDGGVMEFGPDGKLYVFSGDLGRRSQLQNLRNGPFLTAPLVDDTFGGPEPDNAHFTGVILRLNEDGSAPSDNPFFDAGEEMGGEAGANVQKIFSYGHRNGFGMAFDHVSGQLWATENADDAFSEINRVVPGMNGGWIQIAGPLARMSQFKNIETTQFGALSSRCAIPRRASLTPRAWPRRGCSCCPAPSMSIPTSAGSTRSVPPGPFSSRALPSGTNMTGRSGSVRPGASSRSAARAEASTSSASRRTVITSMSAATRGWPIASPTTCSGLRSSKVPRARASSSEGGSAPRPTSSRGRTATCT